MVSVARTSCLLLKPRFLIGIPPMAPKSDMAAFKAEVRKEPDIACEVAWVRLLTTYNIKYAASISYAAFARNPSLVWEFYTYRRHLVLTKQPNPAHLALAEYERRMETQGRKVTVVTQNIDELHRKAGTKNLIELHGRLFEVRCSSCHQVSENYDDPICPALADKGAPEPEAPDARIPAEDLPKCTACGHLLRPNVIWFGENLDPAVLEKADAVMADSDLCMVVGTSSVVYPAAMYAPSLAARGVTVAEFNIEHTPATERFGYHFTGPAAETVVEAFKCDD